MTLHPLSESIVCENLSRTYKSYTKEQGVWNSLRGFWKRNHIEKAALLPTNLNIYKGQVVGLVGANGAGKTTLLKLLSGLIYPSQGTARVLGYNPWERKPEFLKRISILLGQKNQLWWDLSPLDSYDLLSRIYDLDHPKAMDRVRTLASVLKCTEQLSVQLRRLSLGERMKMEIIGALLHQPDVLFLDEPTIGLDIVAQTNIRNFLEEYVKEHRPTLILTSHYMDDISHLADRLLLISRGAIVYDGSVDGFKKRSKTKNRILVQLAENISQDIHLAEGLVLKAGSRNFEFEAEGSQLGSALTSLSRVGQIQDLKIEEVDFESVIREFLQEAVGDSPARHLTTI